MKKPLFYGCATALVTPFFPDGSVDFESLGRLIDRQIGAGIDGLVPCGTTGESAVLTERERLSVIEYTVWKTAGRVPIIAGTGTNSTAQSIRLTRQAQALGADGILEVCPYYNKPSQEGLYQHFKAVAAAAASRNLSVVLYNVPGRVGVNMTAETTLRLANECENIVAIKEASGNFTQIDDIIKNKPKNFDVISGDDGITFPLITLGAVGVISVIGNALPKEFSRMVRLALNGDYPNALVIHHKFTELFKLLFVDGNPAGVKAMLHAMGLIENELRLPLVPSRISTMEKISAIIKELNIKC